MAAPKHRTLGTTVPITEVLDPVLWRERFAYGVILGRGEAPVEDALGVGTAKTAYGRQVEAGLVDQAIEVAAELPDETIRFHLRSALSGLEMRLGIPMGIVVCKALPVDAGLVEGRDYDRAVPRLPYRPSDAGQFYRLDLPPGVISVQRVRLYWYNEMAWTLTDAASIVLEHAAIGGVHLMPTTGALFSIAGLYGNPVFAMQQAMPQFGPRHLPNAWAVDYTLGPVTRTGPQGLEAELASWVAMTAALPLLAIAGQGRTQGINSASISMDGLGKSISLGGPLGVHSALMQACQQALQNIDLNRWTVYKRGLRLRATGA